MEKEGEGGWRRKEREEAKYKVNKIIVRNSSWDSLSQCTPKGYS